MMTVSEGQGDDVNVANTLLCLSSGTPKTINFPFVPENDVCLRRPGE